MSMATAIPIYRCTESYATVVGAGESYVVSYVDCQVTQYHYVCMCMLKLQGGGEHGDL